MKAECLSFLTDPIKLNLYTYVTCPIYNSYYMWFIIETQDNINLVGFINCISDKPHVIILVLRVSIMIMIM